MSQAAYERSEFLRFIAAVADALGIPASHAATADDVLEEAHRLRGLGHELTSLMANLYHLMDWIKSEGPTASYILEDLRRIIDNHREEP